MKRVCFATAAMMVGAALMPLDTAAIEIALPVETASYKPSRLPGYNLTLQRCLICHSAQYVATQPASSPRSYWDATVHKMKNAFGAPVNDEDIPLIVEYLFKTYGDRK